MKNIIKIKLFVVIFLDLVSSIISLNLSNYLRIDYLEEIYLETLIAGLTLPIIFYSFNIYKRPWRYMSITDIWPITKACLLANICIFIVIFIFNRLENIPRLVIVYNFMTLLIITSSARVIYRIIIEKFSYSDKGNLKKIPVLLLGFGDNADSFIRAAEKKNSVYKVIGLIIENDSEYKALVIRGIKVLGILKNLEQIITNLINRKIPLQRLVITSNSMLENNISEILKIAEKKRLKVGRASDPDEIIEGLEQGTMVREISLEDLLGRRQNRLDTNKIKKFIEGRVVIITGAAGTIGSELANRIHDLNPKKILLLDAGENAIYNLRLKIGEKFSLSKTKFLCTNIRNNNEIEKIFNKFNPDIIFHAAALKHVSICEDNISEAIRTNVLATYFLSNMAEKYKCKCFVLISTDKAVDPSSVMGLTKKIAEMIIQSKDKFTKSKSRFISVRFGNVLGSTGSVVPFFKNQIKEGGPITVTDRNVTRFFMTIEEAVDLVLTTTFEQLYATYNIKGSISVLNMGKSIKIDTLAKQMIKLAGLMLDKDIKIKYTGLKKGEKLHENLFGKTEKKLDLNEKGFFIVNSKIFKTNEIKKKLISLENLCNGQQHNIRESLFNIIRDKDE